MPTRPKRFQAHGAPTQAEQARETDRRRGSARARGYTREWDLAAAAHLAAEPLCAYCAAGTFGPRRDEPATLVDHFWPHGGGRDLELFWAAEWWVSSCGPCHSGPKQALERQGPRALTAVGRALGLPPR